MDASNLRAVWGPPRAARLPRAPQPRPGLHHGGIYRRLSPAVFRRPSPAEAQNEDGERTHVPTACQRMNVCIAKALRDGRTDSGSHPKPRIVLQDPPCFAIREATERDADAIFDLICFQAEFDGCFSSVQATPRKLVAAMRGTSPYFRALLAEADGKPIGFASFHQTFSSFLAQPGIWLDDLFVRASHRGHGVGNAWCDTWRYWPTSMVAPASIGLSPPGVSRPAISAPASVRA